MGPAEILFALWIAERLPSRRKYSTDEKREALFRTQKSLLVQMEVRQSQMLQLQNYGGFEQHIEARICGLVSHGAARILRAGVGVAAVRVGVGD